MKKIVAVGLSPTLQKTITFKGLRLDAVNRSTGYRIDASGKAVNASRVLNQLEKGCAVNVCPLGRDNALFFHELASRDGLSVVEVPVGGRVRYCYTLIEPGTGRATELVVSEPVSGPESGNTDWAEAADRLVRAVESTLEGADALLFAGSRPAFWPEDLCARICSAAASRGIPVMADFHGEDLKRTLAACTPAVIKINEEEFSGTFGLPFPLDEAALSKAIAEKSAKLGNTIVITRGSSDTLAASGGVPFRQKVNAVKALNAIGCGDSFTAGFLHEWLQSAGTSSVPDVASALVRGGWCAARNAMNLRPGSILEPDAEGEQVW
ncbi:MAG TPA: PfkB family carbohydrate kinase [Treponemataceae bacterium]|nr:MAG: Tagatose-6-phosphate kinase [Spirochaetes bacterium ADurb.Bin269]HOC30011.1 PfkB family carbohydrate kinase [Treponemataceae bacterium]HQL33090.1 PfkB family carbohydrate kinase [Treponemataceae bacterium]